MTGVSGDQWRDTTAFNPFSMPIATNWAWVKATVAKNGIAEILESYVKAAESALQAGHAIECV